MSSAFNPQDYRRLHTLRYAGGGKNLSYSEEPHLAKVNTCLVLTEEQRSNQLRANLALLHTYETSASVPFQHIMEILVFATTKNTFFGIFISRPYSKTNTDSWWYSGTLPYVHLETGFWNMAVIHQLASLLISIRLLKYTHFSPKGRPLWRILIWCIRIFS